jgi:hypothetical protein
MDPNNAITTAEQQYNEARAVEREEEERGMEKQDGMGKQEAERRKGLDTGEQGGTQEPQKEVQDHPHLLTGHTALNATVRKPQWFNWARDVNDSLGLSPVAHNALQPDDELHSSLFVYFRISAPFADDHVIASHATYVT